jgi:hypothetical protein
VRGDVHARERVLTGAVAAHGEGALAEPALGVDRGHELAELRPRLLGVDATGREHDTQPVHGAQPAQRLEHGTGSVGLERDPAGVVEVVDPLEPDPGGLLGRDRRQAGSDRRANAHGPPTRPPRLKAPSSRGGGRYSMHERYRSSRRAVAACGGCRR